MGAAAGRCARPGKVVHNLMARETWAELKARETAALGRQRARMAEVRAVGAGVGLTRGSTGYYGSTPPMSLQTAASEGFRMSGVIYQCVMKIANPLAALKLGVRQQDSKEYD